MDDTALDHLRKLIAPGCHRWDSSSYIENTCFYCEGPWDCVIETYRADTTIDPYKHAPDCPWLAAKAYLAILSEPPRSECDLMSFYSGVCSRGTRGCCAQHVSDPPRGGGA